MGWGREGSFNDDAMCTQLTVARETAWGHASSYRGDWQQQQHTKIIREIEKIYVIKKQKTKKRWTRKRREKGKQTKGGNEEQPPPCGREEVMSHVNSHLQWLQTWATTQQASKTPLLLKTKTFKSTNNPNYYYDNAMFISKYWINGSETLFHYVPGEETGQRNVGRMYSKDAGAQMDTNWETNTQTGPVKGVKRDEKSIENLFKINKTKQKERYLWQYSLSPPSVFFFFSFLKLNFCTPTGKQS